MTSSPSIPAYTQGFGTASISGPIAAPFAPSSANITGPNGPFKIGQIWIDTVANDSYILVEVSAFNGLATANWSSIGGGMGTVESITPSTGTVVTPTASNINLSGTNNQIVVTGSGSTLTLSIPALFAPPGSIEASGDISSIDGNLVLQGAGRKLLINYTIPFNDSVGTATLAAGTATVTTTAIAGTSQVFLSRATAGGMLGNLSAPPGSFIGGTSFVINSDNAAETSTVFYWIIN